MAKLNNLLKSLSQTGTPGTVNKKRVRFLDPRAEELVGLDRSGERSGQDILDEMLGRLEQNNEDLDDLLPELEQAKDEGIEEQQEEDEAKQAFDNLSEEDKDYYNNLYEESGSDKDFETYFKEDLYPEIEWVDPEEYFDNLSDEDLQEYRDQYEESGSDKDFKDYFMEDIFPELEFEYEAEDDENVDDQESNEEQPVADEPEQDVNEPIADQEQQDEDVAENEGDELGDEAQEYLDSLDEEDLQPYVEEYEGSGSDKSFQDYFKENIYPELEFEDEENPLDVEQESQDQDESPEQAAELESQPSTPEYKAKPLAQFPDLNTELLQSLLPTLPEQQAQQAQDEQNFTDEQPDLGDQQEPSDEVQQYLDALSPEDLQQYQDQYAAANSDLSFPDYFRKEIYPNLNDEQQEQVPQQSQEEVPDDIEQNMHQLEDANNLFSGQRNLLPQQSQELQQAKQRAGLGEPEQQNNLMKSLQPVVNNQGGVNKKQASAKPAPRPVQTKPLTKKQQKQQAKRQQAQIKAQKNAASKASVRTQQESVQSGRPVPYGQQQQATWRKSTSDQPVSIRTTTPEQDVVLNSLYKKLPQGIANLNFPGNQSNFNPIANEARRNFSQKTIPSLAERFAGAGDNRLQSSGFAQALGGAAADFESQLAAQQAQHGLQEQSLQSNNLYNALGQFSRPQFDYTIVPGQNSGVRNVWNGVKQPLLNAGLGYLTGGLGNALGGAAQGLAQQGNSAAYGFNGNNGPSFMPSQNQISTQQLANQGYPNMMNGMNNF